MVQKKIVQKTTSRPGLTTAITGATTATLNVFALIFEFPSDITAGLNLAMSAWIAVFALLLNKKTD